MTALRFTRLVAPTLVVGLMSVAAAAQSIHVRHDSTADFKAFKTYAVGAVTVGGDADAQMVQRIVSAVDRHMSAIGFRKVEKDPDLLVATQIWRGISYPSWWSDQWSELDLNARRLFVGKVVVDVIDAHTQKVVFHGTAKDHVSLKAQRNEEKADEAVAEIFDESPWGADFDDD
jgi:hypothetical protein